MADTREQHVPPSTESTPSRALEDPRVSALAAADVCLQAVAEQAEDISVHDSLPAVTAALDAQALAASPGLQALWNAVLPFVGVLPARPGEFAGVFKVEAGEDENEAVVFVDVPNEPYVGGHPGNMERVLALKVTLAHDYRRLGSEYYCIDCEQPTEETRH